MHSVHLVKWSTITRTYSLLHGARVPENLGAPYPWEPLHMVLEHFCPGMTLRALVRAAGTACGDVALSVLQHLVPAEAVFQPGLGLLVSRCRDVMTLPEDFLSVYYRHRADH